MIAHELFTVKNDLITRLCSVGITITIYFGYEKKLSLNLCFKVL